MSTHTTYTEPSSCTKPKQYSRNAPLVRKARLLESASSPVRVAGFTFGDHGNLLLDAILALLQYLAANALSTSGNALPDDAAVVAQTELASAVADDLTVVGGGAGSSSCGRATAGWRRCRRVCSWRRV
jgi:hypothetical protein